MRSTFSVYFFIKKDKQKANGNYPIFAHITGDSVASRFNTKTDVPPTAWNATAERAIGRSAEIIQVNRLLDEIRASLHTIYHDMQRLDN